MNLPCKSSSQFVKIKLSLIPLSKISTSSKQIRMRRPLSNYKPISKARFKKVTEDPINPDESPIITSYVSFVQDEEEDFLSLIKDLKII